MNFIAELQRRNVIRMAGLYLVGAWLIVQVAGTVLPMFGAPLWLPRSIVIALAIGFIPALAFSWVFELTPDGLKRDADVMPEQSIAPQIAQKMNRLLIVAMTLALAYFGFDKFVLAPRRETATVAMTAAQVTSPVVAPTMIPDIATDPSIAVLPFMNMSSDKEQEYFSDGISEELLNLLSKVPKLRVIARTSSFSFKGKEVAIADIARVLNVAAILEGSVRKSGNTVRISVQLIRASDSTHLWSETYDRTLDDIFKVQDEIAAAVVGQLQIKLLGAAPKSKPIDARAYALVLQAKFLVDQGTQASDVQAVMLYQQALAIAPDEARVWEGLARVYLNQAISNERPVAEGYRLAREAAIKALAHDPDNARPIPPSVGLPRMSMANLLRPPNIFSRRWHWTRATSGY